MTASAAKKRECRSLLRHLLRSHASPIAQLIGRVQNYFFAFGKTTQDLDVHLVSVTDLDRPTMCSSIFDHKDAPPFVIAKCGTSGNLQNAGSFPGDDAGFDAKSIVQPIR